MKRPAQHPFRVSLAQSVRTRLTLWYLAVMAFIIVVFGGSLYATQTFLNADAAESRLETQLYQDSQRFAQTYRQALLDRQAPTALHLGQSSQEMVLLLRPDGSVLDSRGPLTSSLIQQLLVGARQNSQIIDLAAPQNHSHGGIATPACHPRTGDLALSRHAGPAGRGDRGLLAGGQSAATRENDYTHGQRD